MIERQRDESLELYKLRINFLLNFIIPSNSSFNLDDGFEDQHNSDAWEIVINSISEQQLPLFKLRVSQSIQEIYSIGCRILESPSCLLMENLLEETVFAMVSEKQSLEIQEELENTMLELLERKYKFQLLELQEIDQDDFDSYNKTGLKHSIKTVDLKNLAELCKKRIDNYKTLTASIENLKGIQTALKLSREIMK